MTVGLMSILNNAPIMVGLATMAEKVTTWCQQYQQHVHLCRTQVVNCQLHWGETQLEL